AAASIQQRVGLELATVRGDGVRRVGIQRAVGLGAAGQRCGRQGNDEVLVMVHAAIFHADPRRRGLSYASRHTMRILLVEDDAVLGDVMLHSLGDAGHRVDRASTVAEASHLWRVQRFDAVLLDLNLPDGSGLNALREARARDDHTPVPVLTARNRPEERIGGLDAGAGAY